MRTYLILKAKAAAFNADAEIQAALREIHAGPIPLPGLGAPYTRAAADALKAHTFDRDALGQRGLGYERLDQMVVDLLLGTR
jgi:xylose isomerase